MNLHHPHTILRNMIWQHSVHYHTYMASMGGPLTQRTMLKDVLKHYEDELFEYVDTAYVRKPQR